MTKKKELRSLNKEVCKLCGKRFNKWDKLTFNIKSTMFGYAHKRRCY